ncbi:MAG: Gfo/Idh/MocA family oxidoreductase [Clostridiaceae bacterium]|nr:Gfo/Idh/MocA family oxidoreductase [Clostridiaceae bacterium]
MSVKLPLKIALVGCGRVADKHLKAFNYLAKNNRKHGKRAELIALVDPIPQARERIISGYKLAKNIKTAKSNTGSAGENVRQYTDKNPLQDVNKNPVQYVDKNSGQYVDKNTGQYVDKNAGQYIDKNTGQYICDYIKQFDSLEELFAASFNDSTRKPDIVAITTPSGQHYAQAKLALENDCHVFIEKPIAMQLEHAQELQFLAEQKNKKIIIGHIFRYFPVIGLVAQDIAQGLFGKPLYGSVSVRWGHDQAYYDQAAWRGTREHDGGAIMNQSIHALDLMRWLLGEPELISAKGAISTQIHQIESEDLGFGIFELADDRWLMLEGTTNTEPTRPEASFFVRLTEGDIKAGISSGKISFSVLDSNGKQLKRRYIKREIIQRIKTEGFSYLLQMGNPHTAIYIDLIDSILYDRQPLADVVSGIKSLELVQALYQDAGVEL